MLPLLALLPACTGPEGEDSASRCGEAGVVCTFAGVGGTLGYNGDGLPARESMLYWPTAVRFHPDGRVVIDDFNNWRIRAVEADGTLTTIAGDGEHLGSQDGVPATESSFDNPVDIRFAADGGFYVLPLHEARVAWVDPQGIVHHYAGNGYVGYAGDGGPAADAQLSEASGLALGDDGTLYIADTYNHAVRYVTPDGVIRTLAGRGLPGYAGDGGPLDGALFNQPGGIEVAGRTVYVADSENHVIRAIDLDAGTIDVVAGVGAAGYAGDGGPARSASLYRPQAAVPGPDGALWIADSGNNVIRRVAPDGTIETVAGDGTYRFAGDGGPATEASFGYPVELTFSPEGDLYVADMANGAVRILYGAAP